jgi:hypothetical protein
MQTDPPARHSLLGLFQRVCYLVHAGVRTHRSNLGEFASCIPIVCGSCDLLGNLEQQPEATVTSAFVMLMGWPAAMEAAAAREAPRATK